MKTANHRERSREGAALMTGAAVLFVATLAAGSMAQTGETVVPPVRSRLQQVPLPSLDGLDRPVAEQLESARRVVTESARRGADAQAAAYGSLAQLCHAYELFESAEAAYANAARLAPADPRWPYLTAYLYEQRGRFDEAAEQFARVLQLEPGHREAAAHLAGAYLQLNRLRDARERFLALQEVFPSFARNGLGEVALRDGRFKDALDYFRDALARMPQATALHYSLAMAYRGLGQLDQARAELARRGPGTIRLGDPLVDSLAGLVRGERLLVIRGSRALGTGALDEAAEWFTKAVAAAPDSVAARTNLATILLQLGHTDRALEQYEALAQLDAVDEDVAVTFALGLSDRSRFRDAVMMLNKVLARSPGSMRVGTTLARLLAAAPDRSIRDGARALDIAMQVYRSAATAAHAETIALALASLERCPEAVEWMRRGVTAAEQSADAAEAARLTTELPTYQTARCAR